MGDIQTQLPVQITDGTVTVGIVVDALKVNGSSVTQPVSGTVTNVPSGTQTVAGTVTNVPSGTQTVAGTITAVPTGTQAVSGTITNVPSGTQPVSGTITAVQSGTYAVSGTITAVPTGTQTVTGALTITTGSISTNNSTTATLGGGAVFTGTSDDVTAYAVVELLVFADTASAAGGLSLQFSSDGTNWDLAITYSVSASTPFAVEIPVQAKFFRVVYTNGASPSTDFRLQTAYKNASGNPVGPAGKNPTSTNGALAMYIQGITGGNAVPVSGTITNVPSGTQAVSGTITAVQSGTYTVAGTVTNVPSGTQAVSGTITNVPSGTQTVAGTITAVQSGTYAVSGTVTNVPSGTQTVAGTVTNVPSGTQTVAGTVTNVPSGTQAVSGTVTNVPSGTQAVSGTITAVQSGTYTVAGTVSAVTSEITTGIVTFYGTSANVAAASTGTISYTVTVGKTLYLKGIIASSSGAPCKVIVDYGAGPTVIAVGFYATTSPFLEIPFYQPVSIAATTVVNVKIMNNNNNAQDVYATIMGHEI